MAKSNVIMVILAMSAITGLLLSGDRKMVGGVRLWSGYKWLHISPEATTNIGAARATKAAISNAISGSKRAGSRCRGLSALPLIVEKCSLVAPSVAIIQFHEVWFMITNLDEERCLYTDDVLCEK
ncbi:hypothetical protein PanWU01x14_052040 [Parasponia andersonii]|uniref:Uncharacterized protein n=1 Tax=Parasponia andersonii TaxID=3476 RepID=A0A2P5DM51_PARAD|nr:hypothetical protein PanWU01x14_052040 [Parasponia andersonii]